MNTLTEMGIQQWRLKPAFADKNAVAQVENEPPKPETRASEIAAPEIGEPEASLEANKLPVRPVEPIVSEVVEAEVSEETTVDHLSGLDWQGLQALIESNEHCPSCGPNRALLGEGNPNADWMFVVDAPSLREVEEGQLLAGRAGQLFDAMLQAIGLDRTKVYTTSVFKCAPSDDLSVTAHCDALVHRQIQLVEPVVVVTFGEFTAQAVVKTNDPLPALQNAAQRCYRTNVSIVPTHSPLEMLEDPALKVQVWQDLKKCLHIVQA